MEQLSQFKSNIIFAGVGRQGILTASEIVARVALEAGRDVKKSEVKGLSQRGGSVFSFIKIGPEVYSPLIEKGSAELLVAFEKAEALRWIHYIKPGKAQVLLNNLEIVPLPVTLGQDVYPSQIVEKLQNVAEKVFLIEAPAVSKELGNPLVMNTVILGVLSGFLPFDSSLWHAKIKEVFKGRYYDLNLKAFKKGQEIYLTLK